MEKRCGANVIQLCPLVCQPHVGHITQPYRNHMSGSHLFCYLAHYGWSYGPVLVQLWLKSTGTDLGRQTRSGPKLQLFIWAKSMPK